MSKIDGIKTNQKLALPPRMEVPAMNSINRTSMATLQRESLESSFVEQNPKHAK